MPDNLKRFLKKHEGEEAELYRDPANIPTVGVGANLNSPEVPAMLNQMGLSREELLSGQSELTPEQQNELLNRQVSEKTSRFNRIRNQYFPNADLKQPEVDALTSMYYNKPGLIGPNIRKSLDANDKAAVFNEILTESNKGDDPGIQKRRMEEAEMFSGDNYMEFLSKISPKEREHLYDVLSGIKNPHEQAKVLEQYQHLKDSPEETSKKLNRFKRINRVISNE